MTIAVASSLMLLRFERAAETARFKELAGQHIVAIRTNLAMAFDCVDLLVGHFAVAVPGETSRIDFRRIVSKPLRSHSFITAFSWDPKISRSERAVFERNAREGGLADFMLAERDGTGKLVPAGDRDEYFPIFYIEPMQSNAKAVGFDLGSDPGRRATLEAARDSGGPQLSSRISLVQEIGNQYAVLLLAPVFVGNGGPETAGTPKILKGYVSGVFRIGDLIDESRGGGGDASLTSQVAIHLFDMTAPAESRQIYPSEPNSTPDALSVGMFQTSDFKVAGREWRIIATPTRAFDPSLMIGYPAAASVGSR